MTASRRMNWCRRDEDAVGACPRAGFRPNPGADKAYDSEARCTALKARGIKPRIMYKAKRNQPLKAWQVWFNKATAPIRAGVERVFGTMKRVYSYRRVRYCGLARNNVQLQFLGAALNLRRGLTLGLA